MISMRPGAEKPSKTSRCIWAIVLLVCGAGALGSLALAYNSNAPVKEAVTNMFTALREEVRV